MTATETMALDTSPASPSTAPHAETLRWHVLQTKSRQEKALAESLEQRGIHCFLPLVQFNRNYNGRRAKVDLPLFPGYLFLQGTLDDVYVADRTKRVAKIIPVFDQVKLNEELLSVQLALRNNEDGRATFDPFPFLKKGIRVEVTSGPFRGLRGLIEDRTKRDRLILQVNVLGQATSLEVDGALLSALDDN